MAFPVNAETLQKLHPANHHVLQELGGPDGLATSLNTDIHTGLSIDSNKSSRIAAFSDNRLPDKKSKSFLRLMWEAYNDKILLLLTAAALISLAIGIYQQVREGEPDWIEGVAICVAIIIVVLVTAGNDWQKERQFAKLNKMKEDRKVNVVRSGTTQRISTFDVLVGDIVLLEAGDILPVDGILIEGHRLACDQSSMTGESDIIKKQAAGAAFAAAKENKSLDKLDPFLISGAKVSEGIGRMLTTSTGINSTYGKTLMAVTEEAEITPLQAKLVYIAKWIAKAGLTAAGLYFLVLFIMFLVEIVSDDWVDYSPATKGQIFLDIFVVSVSIIVVAVPEGLPLAVMLALAFATTRMLKDNNLVRLLRSCETMGNATTVCSDKTGTLTQNNMSTVAGSIWSSRSGVLSFRPLAQVSSEGKKVAGIQQFQDGLHTEDKTLLRQSIICNTTAHESKSSPAGSAGTFLGSKTETALLSFASSFLGLSDLAIDRANAGEIVWITPFDSAKKVSAAVLKLPGTSTYRVLIKGAPEIVLDKYCTGVDENLDREIKDTIIGFATQSWRTIGVAYKDITTWPLSDRESDELGVDDVCTNMRWIGVFGLQDPLRPGVADAVADCKRAGVFVRMVTGDNEYTAKAIAKECGIYTDDGVCMLGPKFRELSDEEADKVIPKLQVLARSSPEDKRKLVKRLKALGETVAVTGDGTNDAPALKAADVGFAMGISGTEMAKEASAIILMDDNFSSIVKAVMWGRSVNDAVKRFLQFQLTVNITAVLTTVITGIESENQEVVLPAIQLLWVNLIMDTFAALALATDPPTRAILNRKPERKDAALITVTMWKMIIGQALYQMLAVLLLFFAKYRIFPLEWIERHEDLTVLFNGYVWMQIFNTVNNRRLDNKLNVFEGITKNWIFLVVVAIMIGGQILIVFVGGSALEVVRLNGTQWGVSLLLGFISLPLGVALRCIPDQWLEAVATAALKLLVPVFACAHEIKGKSWRRTKKEDEESVDR